MPVDRNKIAQTLKPEQLKELLEHLINSPGRECTIERIRAHVLQRYGLKIARDSAQNFRRTTYQRYVDRAESAQALAKQIAELERYNRGWTLADASATLADASAALVAQELFERLTSGETVDLDLMTNCIARIRRVDISASTLKAKLEEMEVKRKEQEAKIAKIQSDIDNSKGKGRLTEETLEEIERALSLL